MEIFQNIYESTLIFPMSKVTLIGEMIELIHMATGPFFMGDSKGYSYGKLL